jgi:hypothetical protein
MIIQEKNNFRRKLKIGSHYVAAIIVLLHAYNSYTHHDTKHALIYFLFAVLIMSITRLHHQIEKYIYNILPLFNFIEGTLCLVTASHYNLLGKKYLPIAYFLVGILYFMVGAYLIYKTNQKRQQEMVENRDKK